MSNKYATDKIFQTLASVAPKRSVEFQAFAKAGNGTFKVVLTADRSLNEEAIASDIATQTDGRARLIPGSVARKGDIAVAFVKANAISKPFDCNFQMVTASTAADTSGRIWSVVNNNGAKHVVLEAGDDLEGIFKARMNARKNFAAPAHASGIATASFVNGDCVRYVDTASAETRMGIVMNVAGVATVVGSDLVPTRISQVEVVSSVPRKSLPAAFQGTIKDYEAKAELSPDKFAGIVAYLRKAYGEASGPMLERMKELHGKAA
jgi:hypothetical protein